MRGLAARPGKAPERLERGRLRSKKWCAEGPRGDLITSSPPASKRQRAESTSTTGQSSPSSPIEKSEKGKQVEKPDKKKAKRDESTRKTRSSADQPAGMAV